MISNIDNIMIIAMKNSLLSTWNRKGPYIGYNDSLLLHIRQTPYSNKYEFDRSILCGWNKNTAWQGGIHELRT